MYQRRPVLETMSDRRQVVLSCQAAYTAFTKPALWILGNSNKDEDARI